MFKDLDQRTKTMTNVAPHRQSSRLNVMAGRAPPPQSITTTVAIAQQPTTMTNVVTAAQAQNRVTTNLEHDAQNVMSMRLILLQQLHAMQPRRPKPSEQQCKGYRPIGRHSSCDPNALQPNAKRASRPDSVPTHLPTLPPQPQVPKLVFRPVQPTWLQVIELALALTRLGILIFGQATELGHFCPCRFVPSEPEFCTYSSLHIYHLRRCPSLKLFHPSGDQHLSRQVIDLMSALAWQTTLVSYLLKHIEVQCALGEVS